jgi:hypothetical protein
MKMVVEAGIGDSLLGERLVRNLGSSELVDSVADFEPNRRRTLFSSWGHSLELQLHLAGGVELYPLVRQRRQGDVAA